MSATVYHILCHSLTYVNMTLLEKTQENKMDDYYRILFLSK